jgi:hypothetical protein
MSGKGMKKKPLRRAGDLDQNSFACFCVCKNKDCYCQNAQGNKKIN